MKKLIFALIVLLLAVRCQAREITVDDDGPADFNNIQAAIDDANDGDTIIVSVGTYTGEGNYDINYSGKAVTVRSTDPNDPNIIAATIVDCEVKKGFSFYSGEDANSVLSGLTVTNAIYAVRIGGSNPTFVNCTFSHGRLRPMIRNDIGAPTFINCTFTDNSSYHWDSAMYNSNSNPTLINCTFSNNSGGDGVAIYNRESSPILTDCTFTNNSGGQGGAIYNEQHSSPMLTNCTFTNNSAGYGGAIYNEYNSSPVLNNCTFTNNYSAGYGGGIYNWYNSSPILTNCTFTDGSAKQGGGMHNRYSSPILTDCTFTNNSAAFGGGMCNIYDSSPVLTNCTFNGNTATNPGQGYGGGMYNRYDSDPALTDCTFIGNSAEIGGGAIYRGAGPMTNCTINGNSAKYGGGLYKCDGPISNCTITENWAWGGGGGLLFCDGPISDCTISANWAKGGGGLASCDGPISNCIISGNSALSSSSGGLSGCDGPISNCLIIGNSAKTYGGGLSSCDGLISNCTIAENAAGDKGGGIYCFSGEPNLVNCLIWGNTAPQGPQITLGNPTRPWPSHLTISYSDVQGGYDAAYIEPNCTLTWGEGNIDEDPLFVEPGYWDPNGTPVDANDDFWVEGDYHLLADSVCIDAGDPNYVVEPNETDLDGEPRIIGDRIDMVAYEFNPPVEAAMRFTPQALNCKSKGRWVKAYLLFPEGIEAADIDTEAAIMLEPMGIESNYIEISTNNEGLVEITTSFDRQAVCAALTTDGPMDVTVQGSLTDGREFVGSDTVRIINKTK